MRKLKSLFVATLTWAVSSQKLGIHLIRVAILIMTIGILTFLGIFSPKLGLAGAGLAIIMTLGTLSFLVTTPEVWVPDLGSGEHGFPLLSGAGRLVIKDTAILAGAIVVLADSAKGVLNQIKKTV